MNLPLLKTNGLFAHTSDGRLLFFATPMARSAYIVPDAQSEDALRTLAKYWGLCELFSVALIAPIALRFGALGLLVAFAIFAVGSAIAYHYAVRGLVSGLESVVHEPVEAGIHTLSLGSLLQTVADETHASLLWLCEAASVVPFAGAALMLLNGHRVHHFVGGFFAIIFFGSATIAGAYMISMKGRGVPAPSTHSFASSRTATGI
ncbi:MAG TPA: hypothetical protein VHS07_03735 [Candidatus Binataceae bacterium]|jgi:hypothetical protein|nr:hypothetical protein [Candidatus Binataceae bacterium]